MIQQYININRILRKIVSLAWDATHPMDDSIPIYINVYIEREIRELERIWPQGLTKKSLVRLKDNADCDDTYDFSQIMEKYIPDIADAIDEHFAAQPTSDITSGIIDFLHPVILASSYSQFKNGQYRDAVFNSIVAVFDLIKNKTNIDKDGVTLVDEAFSLTQPKLVISEIKKESGRNEQIGFMQILKGAFQAIRSPKAHSLFTDLDKLKASQYLIFASLLARRIEEAKKVD